MKYNIVNVGNSEWFNFKSDIIYGLYHSLVRRGHDVTISHNRFARRTNIVIGADFLANDPEKVDDLCRNHVDYIIYEIEFFDGKTINYRKQFNVSNYLKLIFSSRYVVTPYKANVASYKEVGYSGSILYARWGHFPELSNPNISRVAGEEFHGAFYGLAKGDRRQKLASLQASNCIKIAVLGPRDPHMLREYSLSNARWGLSLSYGAHEAFVNPFRLYYMCANGVAVLCDSTRDEDGYLSIAEFVEFDALEDRLLDAPPSADRVIERASAESLFGNLKDVF